MTPETVHLAELVIGAVVSIAIGYQTLQQARLKRDLKANTDTTNRTAKNIDALERNTNSKLEDLIAEVKKAAVAEGILEGIKLEHARRAIADADAFKARKLGREDERKIDRRTPVPLDKPVPSDKK